MLNISKEDFLQNWELKNKLTDYYISEKYRLEGKLIFESEEYFVIKIF